MSTCLNDALIKFMSFVYKERVKKFNAEGKFS